ncbi:MAG: trehalose-6-phosphate synthase [Cytophagales bacterium]|nr:trehalose-6-phosphate synthase [Cytophagales bacterium]
MRQKTIIVSNRLPVTIEQHKNEFEVQASNGGLISALGSIYPGEDSIWIGWNGIVADEDNKEQLNEIAADLSEQNLVPVSLTEDQVEGFYNGFTNSVIWPVFHDQLSRVSARDSYWDTYLEVNAIFSDIVAEYASPEDVIWIHDIQLMLVPGMLRSRGLMNKIGFFSHIPFPKVETAIRMPGITALLDSLQSADLVGFYLDEYIRNFKDTIAYFNPLYDATADENSSNEFSVKAFPMGIDFDKYFELSRTDVVRRKASQLRGEFDVEKVIGCVCRLDYTKGIPNLLLAYEALLSRHQNLRTKVKLVLLLVPSREDVVAYQDIRKEIFAKVEQVNADFGSSGWEPVKLWYKSVNDQVLSSIYRSCDVMVIPSLSDGMNVVCKEYVASRKEKGVLVLSRWAGASQELNIGALIIDPFNITELGDAIWRGLKMTVNEQNRRMGMMRRRLISNNVNTWRRNFLTALEERKELKSVK